MTIVTLDNIHELTFKFIKENNINVVNYIETMTDVYFKMISGGYDFIVKREMIHNIFTDIAYVLNPNDPLNRDSVLMTIMPMDDSDSDDENINDENINDN